FDSQVFGAPDSYAVLFWIVIDDVTRLRRAARQALSLPDGKHLNSFMPGDEVALQIVNAAAMKLVFAKMRTQERFVILSGHETNFLAIGFVCHLQAKFPRDGTNFRLRHPTKGRQRPLEDFLAQTK